MNAINSILNSISDALLGPLVNWPPILVLVLVAAVSGVLMAVVFRFTSPQQALRRVADRSRAQVLAIKLFKDDPLGIFGCLGQLMKYTGLRLLYSLPPVLVLVVPFVLLMAQLAQWYEYRPLTPGESSIIEMRLSEDIRPQTNEASLHAPSQVQVEARPLRDEQKQAVYWRVRAVEPVPAMLDLQVGSQDVEMPLALSGNEQRLLRVTAIRPGSGFWNRLIHPGAPGFDADEAVHNIIIHYPRRTTLLLGFGLPWWLTFILISMLAAVLVRPIVKVTY